MEERETRWNQGSDNEKVKLRDSVEQRKVERVEEVRKQVIEYGCNREMQKEIGTGRGKQRGTGEKV